MMGTLVLVSYAALMLLCTYWMTKRSPDSEDFCVTDRKIGAFQGSMSIAATWIWAPALFVSAEKAYANGWVGLFWFTVPNVLCLIYFSRYAVKIREKLPSGITLSGYMGGVYGPRVKAVYLVQLAALSVLSSGVQLLAGAMVLQLLTGYPFWLLTVILAAIAYSYSRYSGIRASILTDVVQMLLILAVCVIFVPWGVARQGGFSAILNGLGGVTGENTSLFSPSGWKVFLSFGLPTTIGLISGPFGDQCFWQRAFCIDQSRIRKAFVGGALLFGIVPLCMGALGFVAASSGLTFQHTNVVNFELVTDIFPAWVVIPFLFMMLSGLLSTLDSNLCAVASLVTDVKRKVTVFDNKIAMLLLLAAGIGIANLPNLTITDLFMLYGTLRATTLLPTILTLNGKPLAEQGVFWGVLAGLAIGLPVFIAGTLGSNTLLKVTGCLAAAGLPGLIAVLWPKQQEVIQ